MRHTEPSVCVSVWHVSVGLWEKCVIKHIRSFHHNYKTFPSPIVSAWLDYELSVLSATSWVLHWAGGSIKTRVEEQSRTRAPRGTFFTGEHLIWVSYRACIAWPGSWAHVSAWGRRVPLRQTGRRAYLGSWGLRKLRECWDSALWRNTWTSLICPERQSAEQDKDGTF